MSALVQVESHGEWAQIRIARPEKRNALNQQARQELQAALQTLEGRARVLVLAGSEQWFCCGADTRERAERLAAGQPDTAGAEGIELALAVKSFPGVVIGAVNGLALGFGVNLINACDLAIAASSARLGLPELRAKAYASMSAATTSLSGLGRKRLAWLVFDTEPIDAATACSWGLLNEVVADDALVVRTQALARKIAQLDPIAITQTKLALAQTPLEPHDWRNAMQQGQDVNPRIQNLLAARMP
ncbi:enoyl-CoA hydratase/isomerase family protein [Xylophilus sp. GOD-11R]|uniref:enoyl-CoA hydratase/isomerase family protein n=1 Tax=Xylophilus sp. GOD-11R TaxID=3089814 RepID=UPI00298BD779|nr:enoyl-CoA hydratase/isomerase family protein [Xylophilus sp. GOD-11R]WPB57172.1 enoyl-CoA hydratase/isomerase family protein [Xylophilus sp. GOD-11R]